MPIRTDLAIESEIGQEVQGIEKEELQKGKLKVTRICIKEKEAAKLIGKPMGEYITIEGGRLTEPVESVTEEIEVIKEEIAKLLPEEGEIMVTGLGNTDITPDALGPESIRHILATRHIQGEFARSAGLENLRSVSAIAPGVLGQTGIEVSELLNGVVEHMHPSAVIVIDALAAREASRLGSTVQISNTGICPGSGVGNHRKEISEKTIGVPVIAIGIPTVVDAWTLVHDLTGGTELQGEGMIVTPREIDLLIERASRIIGMAVNGALQPEYHLETLWALVS